MSIDSSGAFATALSAGPHTYEMFGIQAALKALLSTKTALQVWE